MMGEANDFYVEESKKLEEDFLKQLKDGGDIKDVEADYKKKTARLRENFEKMALKEYKARKEEKKKKKEKKDDMGVFKVERVSLELTRFDRFRIRWALFYFRLKRRLSLFFQRGGFNIFKYFFYRMRFFFRDLSHDFGIKKDRFGLWLSKKYEKTKVWLKEKINKFVSFVKFVSSSVIGFFKIRKKEKESGKDEKK